MPKISVIVPVYNVESYLCRCLDSILSQSFQDFEIILVDDGSSDDSLSICDSYAKKDQRIKAIHKENGGASSARNVGLENATGEYISFVDSDDWIEKDYLSELSKNEADLICQGGVCLDEDGNAFFRSRLTEGYYENLDEDKTAELLLNGNFNWIASKLFKTSIIREHHIRFLPDILFAEDTLFVVCFAKYAKSIRIEDVANYRYVFYKSRETLSHGFSKKKLLNVKKANELIAKEISNEKSKQEKIYLKRMLSSYCDYLEQNIFKAKAKSSFNKEVSLLYDLSKDPDFLKVMNKETLLILPEYEKEAIKTGKKSSIRFACLHYRLSKSKEKLRSKIRKIK